MCHRICVNSIHKQDNWFLRISQIVAIDLWMGLSLCCIYVSFRQFVMPGLIDTHIHAPQYPNAGKGLDVGLLDWLKKYTFPTEATFKDLKYADMAYRKAVVSHH